MSEPTILMDEDVAMDALRANRAARGQRPTSAPMRARVVGASKETASLFSSRAAATTAVTEAHPQTVEWLSLERERRDIEARLKALVSRQDALRQQILERWSMDGTSRETVDGLTVHLQRKLYPKVANKAQLAVALQEEGLSDCLTVDDKTFAAYLTACDENGVSLPARVAAHVRDSLERFALVVRLR